MYINNNLCSLGCRTDRVDNSYLMLRVYLTGMSICLLELLFTIASFTIYQFQNILLRRKTKTTINVKKKMFFFFFIKVIYCILLDLSVRGCIWSRTNTDAYFPVPLHPTVSQSILPVFIHKHGLSHSWFSFALVFKSPLITPQKVLNLILRTDTAVCTNSGHVFEVCRQHP